MMLKMKKECEKCSLPLSDLSEACICSFECTFCYVCSKEMNYICPNCQGELVIRPKRSVKTATGIYRGIINKLKNKFEFLK